MNRHPTGSHQSNWSPAARQLQLLNTNPVGGFCGAAAADDQSHRLLLFATRFANEGLFEQMLRKVTEDDNVLKLAAIDCQLAADATAVELHHKK